MTFEEFIKEFLRITTNIKGQYFGVAHLVVAGVVTFLCLFLGIFLGRKKKDADFKDKLKVLRISTIIMLAVEVLHYVNAGIQAGSFIYMIKYELPLFLCDILVFVMPFAAFGKGKIQKSCLDYVVCLGILGMVMGAWFNAWVFNNNPIWSGRGIWTLSNHCIPGFASLFIISSRMTKLEFKNIGITYLIVIPFAILSLFLDNVYGAETNYMFFNGSDGTPFLVFEALSKGNLHVYRILNVCGMAGYIAAFYGVWELCELIGRKVQAKKEAKA